MSMVQPSEWPGSCLMEPRFIVVLVRRAKHVTSMSLPIRLVGD